MYAYKIILQYVSGAADDNCSDAGPGGGGTLPPPPIFGKSVNPILTRGADSAQPLLLAPPNFFHLPAPWTSNMMAILSSFTTMG